MWAKAATDEMHLANETRKHAWKHLSFADERRVISWDAEAREVHEQGELFLAEVALVLDGEDACEVDDAAYFRGG